MTTIVFAASGDLPAPSTELRRRLMERSHDVDRSIDDCAAAILSRVRREGDRALRALARELDRVPLVELEVPRALWERAEQRIDPAVRRALRRAAANIREAHEAFKPRTQAFITRDGVTLGRRPDPLLRVGVYAPGGSACYPSSLLMGVIPARVAGVSDVIVCTPPSSDGQPAPLMLAAAAIAGADRVFAIGGAGAIAALAFGTESVPRVERIVGPGNAYVAAAKNLVSGTVGIDSPAGPSELLIIADASADPLLVAAEMIAQAEHSPDAAVMLLALSRRTLGAVTAALEGRVAAEERADIVRRALASRGAALAAPSLDAAIAFANEWAGEHVMLALEPASAVAALADLRNTGCVFVGEGSSVVFGDYLSGANHVLPTGGFARTRSGLSTSDFVRWTSWQRIPPDAAAALARDTVVLATAEGLPAHASAALLRSAR